MKKRIRITAALLMLSILLTFLLSACRLPANHASDCFEGKGYDAADKAAMAYAEALCEADIDKMLSTFAIETYINNYDLKEFISSRKTYQYYYAEYAFENNGEFQTQVNYYSRIFELVKDFKQLYYYLVLDDADYTAMETFIQSDSSEIEDFVKQVSDPAFEQKMSNSKLRRILTPEMFNDIDLLIYKNAITTGYSYLNCDEIVSFAIEFDFDGNEYYIFVDTGCFEGVWYNISVKSSLGICAGAKGGGSIMYR